jgi:hypothetical protein
VCCKGNEFAGVGHTECSSCGSGTYSFAGSAVCCVPNQYSTLFSDFCTDCPLHSSSNGDRDTCTCDANFFSVANGDELQCLSSLNSTFEISAGGSFNVSFLLEQDVQFPPALVISTGCDCIGIVDVNLYRSNGELLTSGSNYEAVLSSCGTCGRLDFTYSDVLSSFNGVNDSTRNVFASLSCLGNDACSGVLSLENLQGKLDRKILFLATHCVCNRLFSFPYFCSDESSKFCPYVVSFILAVHSSFFST